MAGQCREITADFATIDAEIELGHDPMIHGCRQIGALLATATEPDF
jgi:hypothetical protein